jgi:hypothetical protein
MGKKPVFGMIGLVWAGMALTGCGTCSNCRNTPNKYNATPAFQTRNTKTDAAATPTMVGDAKQAPAPDAGAARMTDVKDAAGAPKPSMIEQTSGTTGGSPGVVPANTVPLSRPTTQSSLRPTDDRGMSSPLAPSAPGMPKSFDDGAPARLTSGGDSKAMTFPPRPVTAANTPSLSTPSTNTAPVPGSSLPPLSSPTAPPAPPAGVESGSPPSPYPPPPVK